MDPVTLFETCGLTADDNIRMDDFTQLCSVIIYQLDHQECHGCHGDLGCHGNLTPMQGVEQNVWDSNHGYNDAQSKFIKLVTAKCSWQLREHVTVFHWTDICDEEIRLHKQKVLFFSIVLQIH